MLQNVHTGRVQVIAIVGSVLFLGFIVELIRKRKIKEEYGLLWVVFAVLFLAISIWRPGLEVVSRLLGIAYAPAAFLLLLIVAVFLILIQFSVAISSLAEKNKKLVQEIGIMRMQLAERSGAGRDGAPDA
ncbi:MAG TPA: DUF2304 domain-containing protein [Candidatus Aminicenantes bacterium]|nr:DUF2304 domain-containing protein [Candidatus Aminicenantes bacterium]